LLSVHKSQVQHKATITRFLGKGPFLAFVGGMATKLIKCHRSVTYWPSFRAAITQIRAFSSANKTDGESWGLLSHEQNRYGVKTVWPDQILGPLGPQDLRFPLPGQIGACLNVSNLIRLSQDKILSEKKRKESEKRTKFEEQQEKLDRLPLPLDKHQEDICEQFLSSVDEIELEFIEMGDNYCGGDPALPGAADTMEYRAHICPKLLRKDFKELFPQRNLENLDTNLTIVLCSLKAEHDQMVWSSEVEEEREKLLETFIQGASEVCLAFEEAGFWADFIDPTSGRAFKGAHTNFTMFETDERYRRLGMEIRDLGCCKVVSHPVWGTYSFIGTLFTDAPVTHPLVRGVNALHLDI